MPRYFYGYFYRYIFFHIKIYRSVYYFYLDTYIHTYIHTYTVHIFNVDMNGMKVPFEMGTPCITSRILKVTRDYSAQGTEKNTTCGVWEKHKPNNCTTVYSYTVSCGSWIIIFVSGNVFRLGPVTTGEKNAL